MPKRNASNGAAAASPDPITRREILRHAALLCALLVVLFPGVFFRGEVIAPGDILFQAPPWSGYAPEGWERPQNRLMSDIVAAFYPYYAASLASLDAGEWPLWNPYQLSGIPLMANFQSTVFYPPRLLHPLLGLRWGTTAFILVKLFLCGMVGYACARALGLRRASAGFFSCAWMFGSYNVIWCNWPLTDVATWLPLCFLGVERAIEGRARQAFFATAAGAALILLAGHPETAFAMALGLAIYFALRLALQRWSREQTWREVARSAGLQAAGWALGLTLCAAQLLPFVEYLLHSATFFDRPHETEQTWLSMGAVASLFVPRFFGTEAEGNYWGNFDSNVYGMVYVGIAVWLGAFVTWSGVGVGAHRRRQVICLAIAGLFGGLLAYRFPGLSAVHGLPVFSSMKAAYHRGFALFALPLTAAIGLEAWYARPRRASAFARFLPWLVVPLLCVGGVCLISAGYIRTAELTSYVNRQLGIAIAAGALGVGALALALHPRLRRAGLPLLTVLALADLSIATRGLNPTMPAEQVFPETELTAALRDLGGPVRIGVGEGNIASGIMTVYGVEEWLGYDGLYPARIIRFQTRLGEAIWDAMEPACAIAYYVHDPAYPPLFPLDEEGRFRRAAAVDGLEIHENPHALPRARLVGGLEVVADADALYNRMRDPGFDPRRAVLADFAPPHGLPRTGDAAGAADIVQHTPSRCVVEADAESPAVLVLADAYYPGWRARVDGERAEIFPAYGVFRGVLVPPGTHRVEFDYAPATLYIGLALSIMAMVVGVVVALRRTETMKPGARGAALRRPLRGRP